MNAEEKYEIYSEFTNQRSGSERNIDSNSGGVQMALDAASIIDIIKDYVNDVRSVFPVDKAVVFGSYAKGTADAQSDIDICFFLDNYGGKRRLDIIEELLGLIDNGEYFEPIVFPTSEIQNDNPFVKEILRTGVEIDL